MSWQDQIAGARMRVDQEFSGRVAESEFSRQQWGLIMTAVEFEVTAADDPEHARIVADTSKIEHILPELDNIEEAMGAMGAGGSQRGRRKSGGMLSDLKDLVGMGDDGADDERKAAAEALVQEYATELQTHLESKGRWEQIRETAATEYADESGP